MITYQESDQETCPENPEIEIQHDDDDAAVIIYTC